MNSLKDKVAIVTGSSRGIGKAIALELARQGAKVVVNYQSSASAAEEVVARIVEGGSQAIAVQADVSRTGEAERLAQAALEAFGTVDILVANAGIARDTLLIRMSEDDWDAVLDTNLKGAFFCAKAVQRMMLRKRAGRIILIGSVVGLAGNVGQANYAAAKAGLIGLGRTLAKELGSRGITVNIVAPGFIQTAMTDVLTDQQKEMIGQKIPAGRMGNPSEIAAAVAYLASEEAAYITGETLHVNGGMAMI